MLEAIAIPGQALIDVSVSAARVMRDLWGRTRWAKEAAWQRQEAAATAAYNLQKERDAERRRREHTEEMALWEEARQRAASKPSLSTEQWIERAAQKYRTSGLRERDERTGGADKYNQR